MHSAVECEQIRPWAMPDVLTRLSWTEPRLEGTGPGPEVRGGTWYRGRSPPLPGTGSPPASRASSGLWSERKARLGSGLCASPACKASSNHVILPCFSTFPFTFGRDKKKITYLQGLHHRSVWSTPQRARHFFSGLPEEREINIHNADVCTLINPHGCPVIKTKTYLHFPELFLVFVFFSDDGSNYYAINYLNVWMRSSYGLQRGFIKSF